MLNAKEIAAMYAEYESLKWMKKQHEDRVYSGSHNDVRPGILQKAGASGLNRRNSYKFIEEQCEDAFINAVNISIQELEPSFKKINVAYEV